MSHSRRDILKQGALFAFAGARLLTPAQARSAGVPHRIFTPDQVRTLESLGEALVPGSKKAGLAHFIDIQLSGPLANSLLMLKYLGINPPFAPFYQSGLAAAARHSDVPSLLQAMAKDAVPDWNGPPAPLFYFVLRNDAIDVVYGTPEGYQSLGVPYMAHIAPPSGWGA
ncbi:MAG: Tat pathway signal protein [Proteobacteria bacterium]|nr:Tat pathway signal protein [Pseudomonadota bacterium]